MSRPPSEYRRRKRRRRIALGLLALALPLTLGGFAYWQDTRFPAHSESVRGLPVQRRVRSESGVASELRDRRRAGPRVRALAARREAPGRLRARRGGDAGGAAG